MSEYVLEPQDALARLMEGNQQYIVSKHAKGDISPEQRQRTLTEGQKPYAIIVTCSDSRVIPEAIFSAGIGELFVIRVAGNVIDKHQLGSIEYAAEHLGCGLLVLLGHTHCGAVGAAIHDKPRGFVKSITDEIRKAIGDEKDDYRACCLNVRHIRKVVEQSLQMQEDEWRHGLEVVGAVYHLEDGHVELLDLHHILARREKRMERKMAMALKDGAEEAQRPVGGFAGARKHIVIQYQGREQAQEHLLSLIRADIMEKGVNDADIAEIDVYIKPEDGAAYYVLNKDILGKVAFE